MRPCTHIIRHSPNQLMLPHIIKTNEIPQRTELLQVCKHEQAWSGQFCGIYPWPADPFEGSETQVQLN